MLHVHRVVVEFYFVKRERFRANVGALQERVRHTVVHALLGHTLAAWDRVFAVVVVALEAIRAMRSTRLISDSTPIEGVRRGSGDSAELTN